MPPLWMFQRPLRCWLKVWRLGTPFVTRAAFFALSLWRPLEQLNVEASKIAVDTSTIPAYQSRAQATDASGAVHARGEIAS